MREECVFSFSCCLLLSSLLMLYKKLKVLSWNVRGLGALDKCNVVRDVIRTSRCDVCLLQETKLNEVTLNYVLRFLPSFFNPQVAYNQAFNTSGGILIAWKRSYELQSSWSTEHTLTVKLLHIQTGNKIIFTTVYGPSEDGGKLPFIQELHTITARISEPWIIAGDFNLVRWLVDRPGDMRGI